MTWYSLLDFLSGSAAAAAAIALLVLIKNIRARYINRRDQFASFYCAAKAINEHIAHHKTVLDVQEQQTRIDALTQRIRHIEGWILEQSNVLQKSRKK